MTFYENFLKLCNDVGKSPSRVADEIGISKSIISRWKNGGGISDITAVKLAEYFGVSTGVLKDNLSLEGLQYMVAKDNGLKKACAFLEAKEKENEQQKKTADQVASRLEEQIKVHGETGMCFGESDSSSSAFPSNVIPLPNTYSVPLLGTIACGDPILAEQNIIDKVSVPDTVRGADFALLCKGDSMVNARIYDGDIVYIHMQDTVENGEIAAVLIGDEATLKRVYYTPGGSRITLRPCNPLYPDYEYAGEELNKIRILGKAIAFTSAVR